MADEMANAMADDEMYIDIYSDESGNSPERQEQDDQQSVTSTNMSVATEPATHQIETDCPSTQSESLPQKQPRDQANSSSPASKRPRVESSIQESSRSSTDGDDDDDEEDDGVSAVSEPSAQPSKAVSAGRKGKGKFLLTNCLPSKVVESSRNKPDELCKNLVPTLQQNLRKLKFPQELGLVNLRLPDNYSNEIGNNSYLLRQILACCMTELAEKGVRKIDKVVFTQVEISNIADILSNSLSQDISIDCIEVPIKAASAESVATNVPNAVGAIISFNVAKICFTDPSKMFANLSKQLTTARWKSLKDETLQKCSSIEKPPIVMICRCTVVGKNKKTVSKSKTASQKSKKLPKKKTLLKKRRSLDTLGKTSELKSFSNDGFSLSLPEVSYRITAYEYWKLNDIPDKLSYKGTGTVVAILDSGLNDSHIAFRGDKVLNIIEGPDYTDTHGHGTMCASIVCGNSFEASEDPTVPHSKNFEVSSGVAPEAKLLVYKVKLDDDDQFCSDILVLNALKEIKDSYSDSSSKIRVDVVSLSLGSQNFSPDIAKAVSDLVCAGVIVVCAACNFGHKFQNPICYPARLGNVLCIGSHNMHGKPSPFSPVGQDLDFLAPGENIIGAGNLAYAHQAACVNGTSYAAPAVAGLICLILECLQKIRTLPNVSLRKIFTITGS